LTKEVKPFPNAWMLGARVVLQRLRLFRDIASREREPTEKKRERLPDDVLGPRRNLPRSDRSVHAPVGGRRRSGLALEAVVTVDGEILAASGCGVSLTTIAGVQPLSLCLEDVAPGRSRSGARGVLWMRLAVDTRKSSSASTASRR